MISYPILNPQDSALDPQTLPFVKLLVARKLLRSVGNIAKGKLAEIQTPCIVS